MSRGILAEDSRRPGAARQWLKRAPAAPKAPQPPACGGQPSASTGTATLTEAFGTGTPGFGLSSQAPTSRPRQNRRTKDVLRMRPCYACLVARQVGRRRVPGPRGFDQAVGRSPRCSRCSMSSSTFGRSATLSIT